MTFIEYVQRERQALRDRQQVGNWIVVVLWLCGVVCGVIYMAGCGATAREVCKATPKVLGGVLEDTGRICTNGARAMTSSTTSDLPASGQGSMESDHKQVISFDEAQALAKSYGFSIGGN